MARWSVDFQVYNAVEGFPYPKHIEMETRDSPSYHCEGRLRPPSDAVLFVHTLSGRGQFGVDSEFFDLPAGTAFLAKSSDPRVEWRFPENGSIPWTFIWMSMFGKSALAMCDGLVAKHGHVYSVGNDHPLIARLLNYGAFERVIHPLSPREGADIVLNLLCGLAALFETPTVYSPRSLMVRQAQEVILKELETGISIAGVAERFNMSREHFSRIFKEETNETPKAYIARQRISRACRLLRETRLSCKEIADLLKYENATNFSRAFKKVLGLTPREFRDSSAMPLL
ncbi:MAG: helix-turn-helix transcriptional regulator [Kiritimatiellaeota bacterium]|nr:helix-turn-helix transcriptional regulator [Kiritimatiellota bacterium]